MFRIRYTSPALDSLFIQGYNPALISLNSVSIDRFNVNQGQTGIAARVRVINSGQASIRVDSLLLTFAPEILNQGVPTPIIAKRFGRRRIATLYH